MFETSSYVSIVGYQEELVIPTFTICMRQNYSLSYGKTVKKLFEEGRDIRVFRTQISNDDCSTTEVDYRGKKRQYKVDKYIHGKMYCFSFYPTKRTSFNPMISISKCPYNYLAIVIFGVKKSSHVQHGLENSYVDEISSYSSDRESPKRSPIYVYPTALKNTVVLTTFSYTSTEVRLSPPPYDTNCFNYTEVGYTSQYKCINDCIKSKAITHGFISSDVIVDRKEFGNSSLTFLPIPTSVAKFKGNFSSYVASAGRSNGQRINITEIHELARKTKVSYQIRTKCHESCSRPSCFHEMMTPFLVTLRDEQLSRDNSSRHMVVRILPPNQPTVTVEAKAKISLLDCLVYLASCSSFWFGFCPLNAIQSLYDQITGKPGSPMDGIKRQLAKHSSQISSTIRMMKMLYYYQFVHRGRERTIQ